MVLFFLFIFITHLSAPSGQSSAPALVYGEVDFNDTSKPLWLAIDSSNQLSVNNAVITRINALCKKVTSLGEKNTELLDIVGISLKDKKRHES